MIKKRVLSAISCGFILSPLAMASTINSSGAYHASLNHHNLYATDHNPAMGSFMLKEEEFWRHSLLGSGAFDFEIGDVNNFVDDIDELVDILDDPDSSDIPANEILDRFNSVLLRAGEDGYLLTGAQARIPILPLFFKIDQLNAVVNVDARIATLINARILDAPLERFEETFTTASALYLKSGIERELSVNYSQPLWQRNKGELFLGAKLKLISAKLSKQTIGLEALAGEDIEDVIEDQYNAHLVTTNQLSFDIGAVWETPSYRLGITLFDANSPEFDYGDIGVNCDQIASPSDERDACNIAAFFAVDRQEITTSETYTKHARLNAQATYKLKKNWLLNTSYDLSEYDNLAGFSEQNFHVSTQYHTKMWLVNSVRLAYQSNMSDDGVSELGFGVTLFNGLNLDLLYGLDDVEIDGSKGPRSLGFAFSITEQF